MARLPLQLPTLQNWSCHNCGGCCRQHLIEVTEAERARIEGQQWPETEGWPRGQAVVEWFAGPFWKKRYRLAHRADGACVFLDDNGLCRIHAQFGEAAKPLPCRIYPYTFHPRGERVALGLRFSCPSVVANKGRPIHTQLGDLRELAEQVVPAQIDRLPPPRLSDRESVTWPMLVLMVETLDRLLGETKVPLLVRLLRCLALTNLFEESALDVMPIANARDFLNLLVHAVQVEFPARVESLPEPTAFGQLSLRMLAAQYARQDTVADLSGGWAGRWRRLQAIVRFTRGQGLTPVLREGFAAVPFPAIDGPRGGLPAGADELLTRYLRVKVQSLHFCGRAYYDVPLIEGFASLVLVLPVVFWLARWKAASDQRTGWELADIERGLAAADHQHGFSPVFGFGIARRRVRALAAAGDISRLCAYWSR